METQPPPTGGPPAPPIDPDSAAFWAGLREHRLVVQACPQCEKTRFPPGPSCPYCAAPGGDPVEIGLHGTIYSWITVRRPLDPAFADEVPYTLAAVDLDDGPRIVGRLQQGAPTIDGRVDVVFHDHPEWTELRFAVAGEPNES